MIDLRHGDCLEVLRGMEADSVDAVVTDPPYGLSFMGKGWDYEVPTEDVWRECLRVLKPGGHLLAFAGTRTQHRMAVRIEDAGFEIRDMIAWVYGSGFPKSMDVSKAIDKRGGVTPWQQGFAEHLRAIKPAWLRSSDINAAVSNGTKSNFWGHFIDTKSQPLLPTVEQYRRLKQILPIDPSWDDQFLPPSDREVVGNRKGSEFVFAPGASKGAGERELLITAPATDAARQWDGWGTALKPALEPITVARKPLVGTVAANVLRHGTGAINVDGCRVEADDGRPLIESRSDASLHAFGNGLNGSRNAGTTTQGRWPANLIHDGSDEVVGLFPSTTSGSRKAGRHVVAGGQGRYGEFAQGDLPEVIGDSGSAARFFYCAKASKADRDEGLDAGSHRAAGVGDERPSGSSEERRGKNAVQPRANIHPTVKPTALMRYLCRLVTPPNGIVLDPFMGSGSTGKAAILEGFRFVGIEREADYIEIARARIEAASREAGLFGGA